MEKWYFPTQFSKYNFNYSSLQITVETTNIVSLFYDKIKKWNWNERRILKCYFVFNDPACVPFNIITNHIIVK